MSDDITRRPDGDEPDDPRSSDGPGSFDPLAFLGGMGGPGGSFDPSQLGAMLEQVLSEAATNPELASMMRSMGVDPTDPQVRRQMQAQLGTFMQATSTPAGARDMATEIARRTVMSGEGNDVHDPDAERKVGDSVHVATMWLDECTRLAAPTWRAGALSRAEWVEATMPQWDRVVRPIASGVTSAVTAAMTKQMGELGPAAFGSEADLPPEVRAMLPEGFDPAQLAQQWAPMLGQLSQQMFTAQLGQAVGTLAAEVVTATEVGLPLTEPGLVALLPGNVTELASQLELDRAQVELYLAVREAARIRLFTAVAWLGPQLMAAVEDYARNITIDTDAIESALTSIDPSDPEAMRAALQGNLFKPTPTPAQRSALDRLETLLALSEGWVDHVASRAAEGRLPAASALAETIRRRRVGGAAQRTFAGLVGLELRPRRLRDAANLFAALESEGGLALRDSAWDHPDVAPRAEDLDDVMGYVERVRAGSPGAGDEISGIDGVAGGQDLSDDLDAVLRQILDDAERGDTSGSSGSGEDPEPGGDAPRS